MTQPRKEGGFITCRVPDVVADESDEKPSDNVVDAACVCCEIVARVAGGRTADTTLQGFLGVVLEHMSGKPQHQSEVERLFRERFKSAGGGSVIKGRTSPQGDTAGQRVGEDHEAHHEQGDSVVTPALGRPQKTSHESGEIRSIIPESDTTLSPGQPGKVSLAFKL